MENNNTLLFIVIFTLSFLILFVYIYVYFYKSSSELFTIFPKEPEKIIPVSSKDSKEPLVPNEALENVSSVYNKDLVKVKNIKATGKIKADNFYPVGSIFLTMRNVDVKDLLGFGSWRQIETGLIYCVNGSTYFEDSTKLCASTSKSNYITCYGWIRID